jgi:D-beta-D-heptose 7-phosphate kinase/D-beta-D-heptose 1-phosphate adenosyltransferase
VKTRIIAHSQQVVRVDQEHADGFSSETENAIVEKLRMEIGRVDAIAVSDYAKGMLTNKVLTDLFTIAAEHGKPVLVDPKGKIIRSTRARLCSRRIVVRLRRLATSMTPAMS